MTNCDSTRLSTVALAAAVAITSGCMGTLDSEPPETEVRVSGLHAGDVLSRGAMSVTVPEPGSGVFAEALFEDGSTQTLELEMLVDGTLVERIVHLDEEEHADEHEEAFGSGETSDAEGDAAVSGDAARAECGDRRHSTRGWRWTKRYDWWFNAGSTPSYLGQRAALGAIRRGTAAITQSRNNCGMADRVSARAMYQGRTSRGVNIGRNASCRRGDGRNVSGFGTLPHGILALTCTWFSGGRAVESDVRFNKRHSWYVRRPANCRGRHDLEGVTAHERGHTFGLGHVNSRTATMRPSITACSNFARTLGRGDVLGLRRLY